MMVVVQFRMNNTTSDPQTWEIQLEAIQPIISEEENKKSNYMGRIKNCLNITSIRRRRMASGVDEWR